MYQVIENQKDIILQVVNLSNRIGALLEREISENHLDITVEECEMLVDLALHNGCSLRKYIEMSPKSRSRVSRLIKSLEKNKQIICRVDPLDKRTKRIYITKKGKETQKSIAKSGMRIQNILMRRTVSIEIDIMFELMQKMSAILNRITFGTDTL